MKSEDVKALMINSICAVKTSKDNKLLAEIRVDRICFPVSRVQIRECQNT